MATETTQAPGWLGASFLQLVLRERVFLAVLLAGFLIAALVYRTPVLAMWFGFTVAGYSAVGNDSIQTIGTFISSNKNQKWWLLWLFIGGIFVVTVVYGFLTHGGDVTYGRLSAKGFSTAPTEFSYLQVAAPLFLLILTRMKMPVSTTFLLLSCFATEASGVGDVAVKSIAGYGVAFGSSIVIWLIFSKAFERWFVGEPHPLWRPAQWVTSGMLWAVWIMQDAANIAVYLPRQLSVGELVGFAGVVFLGLGVLFYMGGERVQEVVDEKSEVVDVRSATMIDLVYGIILYVFKVQSEVPMSTTWVFVGLLGGRELAMALRKTSGRGVKETARMMAKDITYVSVGLLVSLVLAYAVNDAFREQIHAMFG
ncbi:MAG: hypothetical protein R3B82_19520 [Sandaracinaceae bacterium]